MRVRYELLLINKVSNEILPCVNSGCFLFFSKEAGVLGVFLLRNNNGIV